LVLFPYLSVSQASCLSYNAVSVFFFNGQTDESLHSTGLWIGRQGSRSAGGLCMTISSTFSNKEAVQVAVRN
jgi:hypothetical protein